MIKRGSKKGVEFSFAWIFAVIVGAIIIFMAVYITTQFIETQRIEQESLAGKQISILTNPVETNLESAKSATITVRSETRIFNECDPKPKFGWQHMSTSIKSGIGEEWREVPGVESSLHNKYLFSENVTEGAKEFYILSKPLYFPYKVADLIILWPDKEKYCFVKPSPTFSAVEQEINNLKLKNIFIKNAISQCPAGSIKVCFPNAQASSSCDIIVENNQVKHKGKPTVYFVDSFGSDKNSLLYAAIFSDPEIYECQIKRIRDRTVELGQLYNQKALYINSLGSPDCYVGGLYSGSSGALSQFLSKMNSLTSSQSLVNLRKPLGEASKLKEVNDALVPCKQF